MHMGMPLSEYERRVPPINQYFHEYAELIRLHKTGVLPIDPDEQPDPATMANQQPGGRSPGPSRHGR